MAGKGAADNPHLIEQLGIVSLGKPMPRYKEMQIWSRIKMLQKEKARVDKGINALNTVIRLMEERKGEV